MAKKLSFPITKSSPSLELQMNAVQWQAKKSLTIGKIGAPTIAEPGDAIIHMSCAAICGSDLRSYRAEVAGMVAGDVMGHEGVGIVHQVGSDVKTLKPGDKVVISAIIACGQCWHCLQQNYSSCDCTNPSIPFQTAFGQQGAAVFGMSRSHGGYPGLQADYARVPLADMNCLNVTGTNLPDEKLIWLSDALCTGWHAAELGDVVAGQTVAIWGCGPVGLCALLAAKYRGASNIICIDYVKYRLEKAKQLGATHVINPGELKVNAKLKELAPSGCDVCIDAVGWRMAEKIKHKMMKFIGTEVSSPDVMKEMAVAARKGGRLSVVGDYSENQTEIFPMDAFMEKNLQMHGGHVPVQKYWAMLWKLMEEGAIDPQPIVSHSIPLDKASAAYLMFDKHLDQSIKVVLRGQLTA